MPNKQTEQLIEEAVPRFKKILSDFASTVDDNSTYFVKDEEWEKVLGLVKSELHLIATKSAEKYNELIMAVGNKYEGETRHETALRYIKQAEQSSGVASESLSKPKE